MKELLGLAILSLCVTAPWNSALAQSSPAAPTALPARVVAVGIPGVAAVSPVGAFHAGGPIRDKPEFAAFTQPGRILDPNRVLVTSTSNFGAPLALTGAPEGSVLSLDPDGATLAVPAAFAAVGDQAIALNGRVQLFTAQSPAFLNSVTLRAPPRHRDQLSATRWGSRSITPLVACGLPALQAERAARGWTRLSIRAACLWPGHRANCSAGFSRGILPIDRSKLSLAG